MRHDWIFDVLADLRAYANENDLPALAEQVAAALRIAESEIAHEALTRVRLSPSEAKEKRLGRAH
jgi:hypothetical protein